MAYGLPILVTLALWLGSTGVILHLDSQDRRTFVGSMLGAIALIAVSIWLVATTSAEMTPASAYIAFACGIVLWGGQLLSFYTGFVTGPNKSAYSAGAAEQSRFRQAVTGEVAHVLLRPQRAVGANHRVDARFGAVAHHRAQVFMDERLAAHEQQVADMIFLRDIDDIKRFLECNTASFFGIEPVHREPAKIAPRIANVSDGKLKITRPSMPEHFTDELERALPRLGYWLGKIRRRGGGFVRAAGRSNGPCHSRRPTCTPSRPAPASRRTTLR